MIALRLVVDKNIIVSAALDPHDASEQLRTHTNFLQEYSSKLPRTQAGAFGANH